LVAPDQDNSSHYQRRCNGDRKDLLSRRLWFEDQLHSACQTAELLRYQAPQPERDKK
jgi:hypothetical protein